MIRSFPKMLCVFFGLIVALSACDARVVDSKRDVRMEHVVRVFMHDVYLYSVTVRQPGSAVLEIRMLSCYSGNFCHNKVIADVPQGSEMWVLGHRNNVDGYVGYDIHVHSEKDLNGAGWNHGKQGHGMTTVVE